MGIISAYLTELLLKLNESIYLKNLEDYLQHSKCSINVRINVPIELIG